MYLFKTAAAIGTTWAGTSAATVTTGQSIKCYGYGFNDIDNSGLGTLRYATMNVGYTIGNPLPGGTIPVSFRYRINPTSGGRIQLKGDSGGPCFDFWTWQVTGIASGTKDDLSYHEQVKFSSVQPWVIDKILNY